MADHSVVVEGVCKRFRRGQLHDSLRDLIPALIGRLGGKRAGELGPREFWALRDVSFVVRPGEALGIIGPNGAGKSTLLKLLNGIFPPTRGTIRLSGRIGALIEIAAGFHADLTGRENVYLQGAIMGMRRKEIERKFDEIVEFSGIEEFIDTPVKRYSSGMNARLGFSIAAHLDPEILIIDEVLAVGDFGFQQRAFGRIGEMVRRQIPVIVVSHQLDRISTLCTHALLLKRGEVAHRGTPAECISAYVLESSTASLPEVGSGPGAFLASLTAPHDTSTRSGERMVFRVAGEVRPGGTSEHQSIGFRLRSAQTGQIVFFSTSARCGLELPGSGPFEVEISLQLNVAPGIYALETTVWDAKKDKNVSNGPATHLHVSSGTEFTGLVQLNPRAELASRSASRSLAS